MNRIESIVSQQAAQIPNSTTYHFVPNRLIVQYASHMCVPVDAVDGKIHVPVAAMYVPPSVPCHTITALRPRRPQP